MRVRVAFEPRDLWVGVYWDRKVDGVHVYVCAVPCIVVHFKPRRKRGGSGEQNR